MKQKIFILLVFFIIAACKDNSLLSEDYEELKIQNKLLIPPVIKSKKRSDKEISFDLSIQQGITQFFNGKIVPTYGYNGNILGPTLRVKKGQLVNIKVKNRLREYTTVHWHGMLLPSEMDGGPHQVIAPGKEWSVKFKVNQPAATLWYHPHGLGTTGAQVYRGLAGLIIIDDENSEKLNLPKEYGVNDIPLIIQDRRFSSGGLPVYMSSMRDIIEGVKGNVILVNGIVDPVLTVSAVKIRFRLLNGSNARIYNFKFNKNIYFYQIAGDGSFLEKPVKLKNLRLSPGERAEIIVDFSKYENVDNVILESDNFKIIKIKVGAKKLDKSTIPGKLYKIEKIDPSHSVRSRNFRLSGFGHMVSINGKQMDINRIDEYMKINSIEIWNITSDMLTSGMMGHMNRFSENIKHNFHAHGIQFLILSRDGIEPALNEKCWKDTVFVNDNEQVQIITRFLYKGIFMYHCHILEHEDNGMMGQFSVD